MIVDPEPTKPVGTTSVDAVEDHGMAYEVLLEAVREHRWAVGAAYRIGSVGAAHSADVALWSAAGLGAYAEPVVPVPPAEDAEPVGLARPAMMEDEEPDA